MKKWLDVYVNNRLFQGLLFAIITTTSFVLQERRNVLPEYLYQQSSVAYNDTNKKILFNQFDFAMFIFFCLIWYFYFRMLKKKIEFNRMIWIILATGLSVVRLIQYGLYYAGNLTFYFSGVGNILKTIIIFVGYYALFYISFYSIGKMLKEFIGKGFKGIIELDFVNKLLRSILFTVITTVSLLLQERLDIPSSYLYEIYGDFVRGNMNKKLAFNQFDFVMFIFFCLAGYFFFTMLSRGVKFNRLPWIILSTVYAVCMLIGYGFYYAGGIDFYFSGLENVLKASIIFSGYYILFYIVLYQSEKFLDTYNISEKKDIEKFNFFKRWLFLFIAWLPYIIIRYPGGINYDAVRQVDYCYGYYSTSALGNPPLTTFIFGACVRLGEKIVDINFGLFLYCLLQAALMSACFTVTANYLFEKKIKKKWINLYMGLIAVLPIYPIYANVMVKDNLFSMGLMLYTLMLVEMILSGNVWFDKLKYRLTYFISIFLMCTFRFNGKYILIVTSSMLLIYFLIKRRGYKKILLSFGGLAVLGLLINWGNNSLGYKVINRIYNANKIVNTEIVAANSNQSNNSQSIDKRVPSSGKMIDHNLRDQIARVVCKYEEELSDSDKAYINFFMDYDKITEAYNPQHLDSVAYLSKGCSAEERRLFIDTWVKYFIKHPLTYVEAIFHRTYGFFYPGTTNYWNYWGPQTSRVAEELQYAAPKYLENISHRFEVLVQDVEKLPYIYILESIGFALWVILYCIFRLLIKKKWKYLIAIIPIFINFGIVLLGPNFYQSPRYGYPQVYVAFPLFLYVIMITESRINVEVQCDKTESTIGDNKR